MNPLSCAAVRRDVTEFVGGDLARTRSREVATHLAECLACRREAASLQQAHKALSGLRDVVPAAADAAMFEALQRDTLAAVERVAIDGERSGPFLVMRLLWSAAAVMLFGLGWWSVRRSDAPDVFVRQPIPPPAAGGGVGPTALPWAGPRARLRPLGFDERAAGVGEPRSPHGAGMMSRLSLRALEDEILDPTGR